MLAAPLGSNGMRDWRYSAFGAPRDHPGPGQGHAGNDITGPVGSKIRNSYDGSVRRIYFSPFGGGWIIEVEHGYIDELGPDVVTRHMHCKADSFTVDVSDEVFIGDEIATQGRSGNAIDDHDHYEVRVSGEPVDPWPLLTDHQYKVFGMDVGTLYPYWSVGPMARLCQSFLMYRDYGLVVDGIYGPKSQTRLKMFQHDQGLIVDGIVGPLTWDALIPYLGG